MDPNSAWKELCEILDREITPESADRGLDLCTGLYEWVSDGGFAPDAMEHCGENCLGVILRAIESYLEIWTE